MEALKNIKTKISKFIHNSQHLILPLVVASPAIQAQVNLAEGSFRHTESISLQTSSHKPSPASRKRAFELLRSYSSRSHEVGLFGLGWCSNIETRLHIVNSSNLEIQSCPLRAKIRFRKRAGSSRINRFLSMIADEENTETIEVFESELLRYGTIVANSSGWKWTKPDGSWHIFSKEGVVQLDSFLDGRKVRYHYDAKRNLKEINIDDQTSLKLIRKKDSLEIGDLRVRFSEEKAIHLQQGSTLSYLYKYDTMDNLIKITSSPENHIEISYDNRDRVKLYKSDGQCADHYQYSVQNTHQMALVQSTYCKAKKINTRIYSFNFSHQSEGKKILSSLKIEADGVEKRVHFHPVWGYPTLVEEGDQKISYTYDPSGKPIQRQIASKQGRQLHDSQGRLIQLVLTDGQQFKLLYKATSLRPYYISVENVGVAKLEWKKNRLKNIELIAETSEADLKIKLTSALEQLAQNKPTLLTTNQSEDHR